MFENPNQLQSYFGVEKVPEAAQAVGVVVTLARAHFTFRIALML